MNQNPVCCVCGERIHVIVPGNIHAFEILSRAVTTNPILMIPAIVVICSDCWAHKVLPTVKADEEFNEVLSSQNRSPELMGDDMTASMWFLHRIDAGLRAGLTDALHDLGSVVVEKDDLIVTPSFLTKKDERSDEQKE